MRCSMGHSFDLAREGYVYLLRKPLSGIAGDTKEMLLARRSFFERGHYQPLSDTLNSLALEHRPTTQGRLRVLDAGCGEGYYTGRLYDFLSAQGIPQVECLGLDIAKEAIRLAARRYKDAFFAVANLKERLPIPDDTLQILLNVFAPRNAAEFARVLSPGGLLLVALPGPAHLLELRTQFQLLNIEEHKEQHVIELFTDNFELVARRHLHYPLVLTPEEVEQVVLMTPNYWHRSDATRQELTSVSQETQTAAEFVCLLFRRTQRK